MRAAPIMVAIGELEELPLRLESHQVLLSSKPPRIGFGDGGMRGAFRRPRVRRARPPPRFCQFFFVSSTSCLHLQAFPSFNFLLQFLSSFFCIVFGCLGSLLFPSIILPTACAFRRANQTRPFFLFFVFFCLLFFCCFFDLLFYQFLVLLGSPGDPQIKPNLVKICFGRGFLDYFHFCANF